MPTFPLGLGQLAILVAAIVLTFGFRYRHWANLLFLGVALCSAFMLTLASQPLWQLFEAGLAFLQYPWRFQGLLVLSSAFLGGALVDAACRSLRARHSGLLAAGLLLAIGVWALWRLPYIPTSPELSVEAMWELDRQHGQVGATWTGEYLPIWVTEQRWAIAYPLSEPAPGGRALPPGQARLTGVGHTRYDLAVDAPEGSTIVLNQFDTKGSVTLFDGIGPAGNVIGVILTLFHQPRTLIYDEDFVTGLYVLPTEGIDLTVNYV